MNGIMLLHYLENDARRSVMDLADILGESEKDVQDTIRYLEDNKIIVGYHTVINWDRANNDHVDAIIEVSAKPERDVGYDKIAERIAKFPEVSDLYLMSGKSEFFVSVSGRTMREVSDFVGQKLAPIDGVQATVTCFILKTYKREGVILEFEPEEDDRQLVTP